MFFKPVCQLAITVIVSFALICGLANAQSIDSSTKTIPFFSANLPSSDDKTHNGAPNSISGAFGKAYSNGVYYNQWNILYQAPLKIGRETFVKPLIRAQYNDFGNSVQPYGAVTGSAQCGAYLAERIKDGYYLMSYAGFGATRTQGTWYGGGQASLGVLSKIARSDSVRLDVTYYADSISDPIQFPNHPSGYEFTAACSLSLGSGMPSVNGSIGAYRFYTGTTYNGWRLTGDISSPFNMLTLRGEVGYDPFNGNFRSLSAMLTYPFSLGL